MVLFVGVNVVPNLANWALSNVVKKQAKIEVFVGQNDQYISHGGSCITKGANNRQY